MEEGVEGRLRNKAWPTSVDKVAEAVSLTRERPPHDATVTHGDKRISAKAKPFRGTADPGSYHRGARPMVTDVGFWP